jgi:hypothetical protein
MKRPPEYLVQIHAEAQTVVELANAIIGLPENARLVIVQQEGGAALFGAVVGNHIYVLFVADPSAVGTVRTPNHVLDSPPPKKSGAA